jgi:cob(I)alamin adenosyltransferase
MKIYTRSGDHGETSLFTGGRVRKDDPRVDAYGTVDELNSVIGLARAHGISEPGAGWLEVIQNELFVVGADLATPLGSEPSWLVRLTAEPTAALEARIDQMDTELPPLRHFILPGGTVAASTLHIARTVCRRAERACLAVGELDEAINPHVVTYLNRLSDFLFVLARWVNTQAGEPETKWESRGAR